MLFICVIKGHLSDFEIKKIVFVCVIKGLNLLLGSALIKTTWSGYYLGGLVLGREENYMMCIMYKHITVKDTHLEDTIISK